MRKTILSIALLTGIGFVSASLTSSIVPTGVGFYNAWTPSTGTTHYTLVDEASCNGTTDYVRATTLNAKDSFAVSLASVPDGATITGISITPCASRNTSKASSMALFYRLNGVDSSNGTSYALSGTNPTTLASTNFSSLSITKTATTSLEVGAVLLSGTGGARLSRIATSITYVGQPVTPNFVTATKSTTTPNTIRLNWSTGGVDNTSTLIERSTDGVNFTFASSAAYYGPYVDTGLPNGTYYYRVAGVNVNGTSAYSTTTAPVTLP